ncbi:MAG: hypothetical protein ACOCQD_05470 [archaeon]
MPILEYKLLVAPIWEKSKPLTIEEFLYPLRLIHESNNVNAIKKEKEYYSSYIKVLCFKYIYSNNGAPKSKTFITECVNANNLLKLLEPLEYENVEELIMENFYLCTERKHFYSDDNENDMFSDFYYFTLAEKHLTPLLYKEFRNQIY